MNSLLLVIIPACIGAIPAMITAYQSNRLIGYKVDELIKKQEKYNNLQERMSITERDLHTVWDKHDDLAKHLDELGKKVEDNKINITKLSK